MLELAILGLLIESPMHGYELRKRLTGLLGAFRAFSYGSLYPALRRMQAEGLIAENAAPTGMPVRRARRVYQLTDAGRRRFGELVADTGPHNYTDDGFGVHLAFFNRTPPKRGCASWKAVAARWRNAGKACVTRWPGLAARSTATPASCINSDWSPASVRSSGSTSSSPPNAPHPITLNRPEPRKPTMPRHRRSNEVRRTPE
ncbi:transcriptional regulator PadR-like family protein [Mycobacterium ulcerans str. Harvey]|uniref:Transcriptional regulator PadR-like family protein n=1 Tax=Mycobacterium ulcerans str. Harvey TaxID=1299332 RepID=A0ABN0R8J8_MYCUL|nr:transcriptional regulator PadR-like family protein [Mycobacterium ulcerans str. Harvey]